LSKRFCLLASFVLTIIGFASLAAGAQSGRTFYIDYASGSNSNNGTSKTTPWKTHPYMQASSACTVTGSAPAYGHQAGDRFIFKGGGSWPAACFEMSIPAGGTSSTQDYYGVDQNWFVGSSWSRPVFDLNYTIPGGNHVVYATSGNPGYMTFDNFEIKDQLLSAGIYGADDAFNFYNGDMGTIIENVYIHDWATDYNFTGSTTLPYGAGSVFGYVTLQNSTISDQNGHAYVKGVKLVGSANGAALGGACQNCKEVKNTTIHDTLAACFTVQYCHDNNFYNIYQGTASSASATSVANTVGAHTQVIEDDNPCGASTSTGGFVVYNNAVHDNLSGVNIFEKYNSYIFNNVLWNNGNNYGIRLCLPGASYDSGSAGYIYNNTVDCSAGSGCLSPGGSGYNGAGTLIVRNNLWITDGTPTCFGGSCSTIATLVMDHNYTMPTSEASRYGFTPADLYYPSSSDSKVAAAGSNLASQCSGNMVSLCKDPRGAFWYGGSYENRPAAGSGNWDIGSYEFAQQSSSAQLDAPSGLIATFQ